MLIRAALIVATELSATAYEAGRDGFLLAPEFHTQTNVPRRRRVLVGKTIAANVSGAGSGVVAASMQPFHGRTVRRCCTVPARERRSNRRRTRLLYPEHAHHGSMGQTHEHHHPDHAGNPADACCALQVTLSVSFLP
jgi:hypothetical protein